MAGILSRLKNLFTPKKVQATAVSGTEMASPLVVPWRIGDTRREIELDLMEMDKNDSLVSTALDIIAETATCLRDESIFGFRIELEEASKEDGVSKEEEEALELLRETAENCGLLGLSCFQLVREMLLKGDVFCEVRFTDDMTIGQVWRIPYSWQIIKNVDEHGNLKNGDPNLAMSDPKYRHEAAYIQVNEQGAVLAAFWPFQIVHFQFGASSDGVYTNPMLRSSIVNWKRLQAQEDALAVARITRAWDTNVHKILVPIDASPQEVQEKIKQYRQAIESSKVPAYDSNSGQFYVTSRNNPINVSTDYYLVSYYNSEGTVISGEIERLQPSTAPLDNINDIYWSVLRLLSALRVPMDQMGLKIGQRAFIDKTAEKGMESFSRFIRRLQASHAIGVQKVLDMQLLLSGYDPRKIKYKLIYPEVIPQSAEIATRMLLNRAQAATYWSDLGIPKELIGKHILDLTPQEIELWRTYLQQGIRGEK